MKKPIILHITPSLMIGGAEKLLLNLLTNFQNNPQNVYEHQVVYFQAGPLLAQIQALGIKTYQISGLVKYCDPICLVKLFLLVKKIKPYKLHAMLWSANFYTSIVGKLLNIHTICAIHSYHNNGNIAQDSFIKLKLDQIMLRLTHKIVIVSPNIAQKIIHQNKLFTINNGVNIPNKLINKTLVSAREFNTTRPFVIGHVGRFVPVKNQILLIKALNLIKHKLPNFKVIMIGDGELKNELQALAQDSGLLPNISFISTNKPELYYAKFDCFVLPSNQEGQSIALLEAMSFQIVPIITSPNLQHDIVINLYNGLICKPNDPNDLARAIFKLAVHSKLRNKLAQNAYFSIQNRFNLTRTANQYLELYKSY